MEFIEKIQKCNFKAKILENRVVEEE